MSPRPEITLLLGAGASEALGAPSTCDITKILANWNPEATDSPTIEGLDKATLTRLKRRSVDLFVALDSILGDVVTFELALYALETLQSYAVTKNQTQRKNKYRHILTAFTFPDTRWQRLCKYTTVSQLKDIYTRLIVQNTSPDKARYRNKSAERKKTKRFLRSLEKLYALRLFTLNYDTTIDGMLTWADGFAPEREGSRKKFSREEFAESEAEDSDQNLLCHLHGSVLYGYKKKNRALHKFTNYEEAVKSYVDRKRPRTLQSGERFGSEPIVSGFNKMGKIGNLTPYGYYYGAFINSIIRSPMLIILGYGFHDEHVNYWLEQHAYIHGKEQRAVLITNDSSVINVTQDGINRDHPASRSLRHRSNDLLRLKGSDVVFKNSQLVVVTSGFPLKADSALHVILRHLTNQ